MLAKTVGAALLVAAALMAAGGAVAQEAPLRVAVVDLDRLVAQSTAGQALQSRLTAFQQSVQTEGQKLADKATATRRLIADGANSLSEDRLVELQKQLEDETIAVNRFRDDKQREGQKIQNDGLKKIEEDLQPILDQIQTEGGYDLMLNKVPGVVIMAGDRVDITARVIALFNQTSGGGG